MNYEELEKAYQEAMAGTEMPAMVQGELRLLRANPDALKHEGVRMFLEMTQDFPEETLFQATKKSIDIVRDEQGNPLAWS